MQNKGVIRLFTILFALASLYELSFTYVANSVESEIRDKYANTNKNLDEEFTRIGDSVVYDLWFTSFTYNEVKAKELNLGLDLRGGMNVILELAVQDVLEGMVGNPEDEQFKSAISKALEAQANGQEDFLAAFFDALDKERGSRPLSDPNLFGTKNMTDRLGFNADDAKIKEALQEDVDAAIENVYTVLKARIDQFGVVQPNVQRLDGTGRILVELPGVKDPKRVERILESTARLEFWRAEIGANSMQFIVDANERLRSIVEEPEATQVSKNSMASNSQNQGLSNIDLGIEVEPTPNAGEGSDTIEVSEESLAAEQQPNAFNPLLEIFYLNLSEEGQAGEGPIIGYALPKDTGTIGGYLRMPEVRNLLPGSARNLRFLWTKKNENGAMGLLAIKPTRNGEPELEGSVIVDARQEFDQGNNPIVTMVMNGQGAQKWQQITKEESSKNPKGYVAVVLDNLVYSYPRVNTEISGGRTEISGGFTLDEATDLANILKAGKLPVAAKIVSSDVVGPSLGKQAIDDSLTSFGFALLIVLLYMIFYYSEAGIGASLALVVNMFFIFGVLDAFGAVLTLPGMAGIVLTIGMAVDANVLIYDRIREELASGKSIRMAIADGYKFSRSAILDANLTTLLTAIILYSFGTGPIRGFATTLIIGIASSLFTAIFITRLYFEWRLKRAEKMSFATKVTKNWFTNTNFNFLKYRKVAYIISTIMILASLSSLFTKGLSLGVDFEGGRTYHVVFDQPVEVSEVADALGKVWVDEDGRSYTPVVKTFNNQNEVVITTNYRIDEMGVDVDQAIAANLYTALKPFYQAPIDSAKFFAPDSEKTQAAEGLENVSSDQDSIDTILASGEVPSEEPGEEATEKVDYGLVAYRKVGPTIADDIRIGAIWAVVFSLLGIFLYLLARFSKWQYSLGAVAATIHDTIIVLGAFSLLDGVLPFSLEVDQAFIAAILTVIGYSLNDTVVVFDRIREYFSNSTSKEVKTDVLDKALNATLSRTFNTSFTTIIVLLIIFVFGGVVLRGFIFAILLGIVVGTYSSLFIASPVLHDTTKRIGKEKPKA